MEFAEAKFLSAKEKEQIFKQWIRFLDSGFDKQHFGEALYTHLHLNCSFIAHYNRQGFYSTYFEDSEDTPNFLQQFDKDKGNESFEYGIISGWIGSEATKPYEDINQAMISEFEKRKKSIYANLKAQTKEKKLAQIKRLEREVTEIGTTVHQQTLIG